MDFYNKLDQLKAEIAKKVIGQKEVIDHVNYINSFLIVILISYNGLFLKKTK